MRKLTPILLVAMMAAFGGLVAARHKGDDSRPLPTTKVADGSGSAKSDPTTGSGAVDKTGSAGSAAATEVKADPKLARPLRTIALGWEFLAPGVIANDATGGKTSAFKAKSLDVSFANATSVEEVESALAKGGGEATGADIAIMPLSSYVASYERLRALSPEVAFVVGWSRGREALYGEKVNALAKLPATGAIKLAAVPGKTETFFALFLLDLAGVPASRVEIVQPGSPAPLSAMFRAAKLRPVGKLLLTSADTPHLVPIVAVVPHGLITTHAAQLEQWARIWLEGVEKLQTDVPAGARLVAAQPGAPQVVGIIEALGQIEFASLRANAIAAGLSGRGQLTLDENFRTTWRIWRDAGVLTTPPPEVAPLYPGTITALVRTDPATAAEPPRTPPAAPATDGRPAVLLSIKGPTAAPAAVPAGTAAKPAAKPELDAWVARVGFLASVFDRLPLRIAIAGNPKLAQQVVDTAKETFNLRANQLVVAKTGPSMIEVLSAP